MGTRQNGLGPEGLTHCDLQSSLNVSRSPQLPVLLMECSPRGRGFTRSTHTQIDILKHKSIKKSTKSFKFGETVLKINKYI